MNIYFCFQGLTDCSAALRLKHVPELSEPPAWGQKYFPQCYSQSFHRPPEQSLIKQLTDIKARYKAQYKYRRQVVRGHVPLAVLLWEASCFWKKDPVAPSLQPKHPGSKSVIVKQQLHHWESSERCY